MRMIDADALTEKCGDWYVEEGSEEGFIGTIKQLIDAQPTIKPERKTGHWILNRSGAYCCSKCMEPCATYVMMKPRDKFCKMCGSRNEVTE